MINRATAPRRVLIVVQNLPVPFDRRVWLEATTLTQAGYQVSVICPKMKGFNRSFEVLEGVHVHRYGLPVEARGALGFVLEFLWCFVRTAMKTVRVGITGRGFDVLHVCNPPETYWPLAYACKLFGKRFLFDHHDLSPEMYQAKFGHAEGGLALTGLRFLERQTFRAADVVITVNDSHQRIAADRGGVAPERVHIVRSGPSLERFKRYEPDPAWRAGKRHLLVYLGEITQQDGVDHLVRVLRLLRDDMGRDDVHCVLIGGGPHQAAIRSYARELGVLDLCTFTGNVSDDELLCRILSSADVAVVPDPKTSWSDQSTMNKVMEYMYFGLPIAAYDLTENRVSAQAAAVYAAPDCEEDLARHITGLLHDEAKRREMGEVGRRRLHDQLAWEHSVPVLLEAYDSLFRDGR